MAVTSGGAWWACVLGFLDFYGLALLVYFYEAGLDFIDDGCCWPYKCSFHILMTYCWGLYIQHLEILRQPQRLLPCHHPTLHQIRFIANQHQHNILIPIIPYILHPTRNTPKRIFPSKIKHYQSSRTSSIIRPGNRFELFLTSCIPNL